MEEYVFNSDSALELDNDVELKQKIKDKANELGIIVECGMLEDLPNIKNLLAALVAGVACSMLTSHAEGSSRCSLSRDFDSPQIDCQVEINDISRYFEDLPTNAINSFKQFNGDDGLILVQFTQGLGGDDWMWSIDTPDNFRGKVDGARCDMLNNLYNTLSKQENEEELVSDNYESNFEESFITTYTKSIAESVETGSFDTQTLHDSFVKIFKK